MGKDCGKILYTASTDGHLRSFHLPYLRALADAGCAVTAAAAGSGAGLGEGVDFVEVPFTKRFASPRNLAAALRLARLVRRERFDVVLTHTALAAFFTRLGVMLAGKRETRVVNTVHGYLFDEKTPALKRAVLLGAEKFTARATDEILVMNRQDAVIAEKHRLCRGGVTRINGMGVPLERFSPASAGERKAARAALGLPEDAFVLVYAAEFSPRKNQRMLLEALPLLPQDVWLLLPGRGELLEECRALAERLGVAGRARLPGFVEDAAGCCHAADVCVSASRSEGLPFHLMEGMSCGLPAAASRVKGNEDLVSDGENGVLFPFNDTKAFCRCVERLRSDPAARAAMGQNARKSVEKYDLARVKPVILAKYLPCGAGADPGR